jgi:hypothetical protein
VIRAVVDTNVWISALLNPAGGPAEVIEAWVRGGFVAVVPDAVLVELRAVLMRDRIRRRTGHVEEDVDEIVRLISEQAEVVATVGKRFGCRDPKDDAILEAATTARAPFIVTRDDDLKRDPDLLERMVEAGVTIASVTGFLAALAESG